MADDVKIRIFDPQGKELCAVALPASPSPPEPRLGRYGVNLALMAILGIAACAWFAFFTDDLPVIAATLGLGGALVWVAFLGNLVGDSRKKELQALFDQKVMNTVAATSLLAIAAIFLLIYTSSHGALEIVSRDDTISRFVTIYETDVRTHQLRNITSDLLIGNGKLTTRLGSQLDGKAYVVRVTGFPAAEAHIQPFVRTVFYSPSAFKRTPVLLLHIAPTWARVAAVNSDWGLNVAVKREGVPIGEEALRRYDGRAVWIGCDSTVQVPNGVREKWPVNNDLAASWAQTTAMLPDVTLRPNDVVEITLLNSQKSFPLPKQSIVVSPAAGYSAETLQEVYLTP